MFDEKGKRGAAENLKPWMTGANDTGIGSAVDAIYAGEDNRTQEGVDVTGLNGVEGRLSANAATESFDEPLTAEAVLAIVGPFII